MTRIIAPDFESAARPNENSTLGVFSCSHVPRSPVDSRVSDGFRTLSNSGETSADRWREAAISLWQLLDNIDTSTDAFKAPEPGPFSESLHRRLRARHEIFTSDGYSLFWPDGELVDYHPGAENPPVVATAKAQDNGQESNSGGDS